MWEIFLGLTHVEPEQRWKIERIWQHPWVVRNMMYLMDSTEFVDIDQLIWYEPARQILLSYRIPVSVHQSFFELQKKEKAKNRKNTITIFTKLGRVLDWRDKTLTT